MQYTKYAQYYVGHFVAFEKETSMKLAGQLTVTRIAGLQASILVHIKAMKPLSEEMCLCPNQECEV